MHVCVCVFAHGGQRSTLVFFLLVLPFGFLRQSLSPHLGLAWTAWQASEPQSLSLSSAGVTVTCSQGPDSHSYSACTVCSLPTTSLQPQIGHFPCEQLFCMLLWDLHIYKSIFTEMKLPLPPLVLFFKSFMFHPSWPVFDSLVSMTLYLSDILLAP